jgi:magnesium-transporting ATPase (P-type)
MLRFKKSAPAREAAKKAPVVQHVWRPRHTTSDLADIILNVSANSDDPLDSALHSFAKKEGAVASAHLPALTLPFDQSRVMSGNLWHHGAEYRLFVKGAPELLLARCDLTENESERALTEQHKLAKSGFSVFALAHMTLPQRISSFHDLPKKSRFEFDGLVALTDAQPTENNT